MNIVHLRRQAFWISGSRESACEPVLEGEGNIAGGDTAVPDATSLLAWRKMRVRLGGLTLVFLLICGTLSLPLWPDTAAECMRCRVK